MPSLTEFCPGLRANGSCLDPTCRYGHIMHACKPCGFICSSQDALNSHLQSKSHKKKLANPVPDFYKCTICNRVISSGNWQGHSRGTKHVRKCKLQGIIPEGYKPPAAQEAPGLKLCTSCDKLVVQSDWKSHLKSPKHRKLEEWSIVNTALEAAELDKNGVSLRGDFNFDFIELTVASTGTQRQTGTISLTDSKAHVRLVSASLATSKISKQSPFILSKVAANQTLKVGSPIVFSVALKQSYPGRAEDRLELLFKEDRSSTQFFIVRPIYAIIGNKADHDRLKPAVPYKAPSSRARQPETNIVPGIPPEFPQALPKGNLPQAKIPADLDAILSSTGTVGQILQQLNSSLVPAELNSQTYTRRFRHLVWIEEHRLEQDMSMYDMFEVKLTSPQKVAFRLIVPGLAEKRPSVLMGDQIVVQPHALANGPWFQGFVHTVEQNSVLIHFGGTFRKGWNKDSLYNVRFKLNRTMIRREQWALGSNFCEERVLFPTAQHLLAFGYVNATTHPVQIVNPDIGTNVRQLQAVVSIANAPKGSLPFIIFGPPGTGKTVTVVEAIRQVLKTDPTAKIFACAPSNSAADLIAQRLMDLGKEVVFRFYAPSRQKLLVPSELMNFTFLTKDGQFSAPTLDKMKTYRVVIATCGSASFATLNVGMPRGHFTHIFVDEAGQASEPEVMIAVKTLPDSKTNIILSGDPKQLGPVIRSAVARRLNMEESYLERLMKTGPYDIHANFGVTVVKLVKNFRSHNAILKFPNERFYEDELQACGNPTIINSFLNSQYLPNGKFPVVFHGVQGKDDREASSPSFFNVDEILVVTDYVKRLLAEKSKYNITEEDIGVISPYNAQSRKIRTELKRLLSPEMQVKVDSVEGFQGQERRVIIISTVRSSSEHIEYDLKHTLGFVASPRRFNVAVTRAQALLIVIGDPTVLSLDPLWRSFLNYIHNNRGWTGSPITWDPTALVDEAGGYDKQLREAATTEMKELTKRIEELTLANVEAEGDVVVDRPWRNDD